MTKQELAAKIWTVANALRKNIKAQDYKNYIIGFMFYKYLSDNEIEYVRNAGGTVEDLDTTDEDTIQNLRDDLGYFIHYNDLFSTWETMGLKLGADTVAHAIERFYQNLNEKYARVFYVYNRTVDTHSGVFDALDSGLAKLGENAGSRDRAVRDIVGLVSSIPPKSRDYDVLGYIYEYLIKQFSSEAKRDGAFYTPHELTSLIARIVTYRLKNKKEITVYDPCTGTGGLLLNIGKEAGRYMNPDNITYYGQELITETSNLAKMNLFMQDVPVQNIILRNGDTLDEDWPFFDDSHEYKPLFVDACCANPPYSANWDPELHNTDARFRGYGLAPKSYADYAFLLHCLYHIKPDGIMAIVLPHGILFRGGAEGEIRKNLIENNNIETIISMPANLFFATGIPVVVLILSKNRADDNILFIDASQNFTREKNQNVLRESDVQRIFDAVIGRNDMDHFARLVSKSEIVANDYNLNIPRYVSAKAEEEPYDLYSVMTGKIPNAELMQYRKFWTDFPGLRGSLFLEQDGYNTLKTDDIKKTVESNAAVRKFLDDCSQENVFGDFLYQKLIDERGKDKNLYEKAKDKIFSLFSDTDLVDPYDLYQKFAEQWTSIEGDLSVLSKGADVSEIFSDDLIAEVIFLSDTCSIGSFKRQVSNTKSEKEQCFEELDEETKSFITKEGGKLDVKKITPAIKSGEGDTSRLNDLLILVHEEKNQNACLKDAEKKLSEKVKEKRACLSEENIEELLYRKWVSPIEDGFEEAPSDVIHAFENSLETLKKKYANPLSEIEEKEQTTGAEMSRMMDRLHGNTADDAAISMLKRLL